MRRLYLACCFLAALLIWPTSASSQPISVPVDTESSVIHYTGHHRLHDWRGTSEAVEGTLGLDLQNPAQSRVEIEVPVASFDSGNGNRDSNMLDVVEADQHPTVRFVSEEITAETWSATDDGWEGTWQVQGQLTFHGQTHPLTMPVDLVVRGDSLTAQSTFEVSLERYDIDRPKLLFMPIGSTIDMEATLRATLPASGAD